MRAIPSVRHTASFGSLRSGLHMRSVRQQVGDRHLRRLPTHHYRGLRLGLSIFGNTEKLKVKKMVSHIRRSNVFKDAFLQNY